MARSSYYVSKYKGIRYDQPRLQAEFERLLAEIEAAERARAPYKQRFEEAERNLDVGATSRNDFEAAEDRYIAANNKLAATIRAADQFLARYKNYRVEE